MLIVCARVHSAQPKPLLPPVPRERNGRRRSAAHGRRGAAPIREFSRSDPTASCSPAFSRLPPHPIRSSSSRRERARGGKTQNPSAPVPAGRERGDGGGRGHLGIRRRPALRGQRGLAPRRLPVLRHHRLRQGPAPLLPPFLPFWLAPALALSKDLRGR